MAVIQEIKVKKKSLREILPPRNEPILPPSRPAVALPPSPPPTFLGDTRRSRSRRRWILVVIGLVIIVVAGYLVSQALAKVTVEVTPATIDLPLSDNLTVTKTGPGPVFDVITLPAKIGSRTAKTSGLEEVSRSASGQVVIYNDYNKTAQKLVTNTRLQTKTGKIYRLHESVIVPGQKIVAGKVTPGSVEVTVYADKPGAESNSDPADFTIPGFQGDPRYTKFFGRSKTPLAGGAIGQIKKVSDADAKRARTELEAQLTKDLLTDARAKIPATYILFSGTALVDFKDATDWQATSTAGEVLLKESAVLRGVMLPRQELAEKLIGTRVPNFAASELSLVNLDELAVTLNVPVDTNLSEAKTLTINVKSSAHLVPIINQIDLATKLAGAAKSEVDGILSKTKGIAKARVIFWPPWLGHVPADPARIEVKLPQS